MGPETPGFGPPKAAIAVGACAGWLAVVASWGMASTQALEKKVKDLQAGRREALANWEEAQATVEELEPQCFSFWGRLGLMAAGGATAFLAGKGAAFLQQKGGPRFAWDGLVGAGMQLAGAAGESRVSRFVESEGRALFEGAMGRLGFMGQLEQTEVNGRMALLLPGAITTEPTTTNGKGGAK